MPLPRRIQRAAPPVETGWTRFRGPNGNGIGAAKGIRTPTSEADFAWKVALPGIGHSSPVLWQDRIFVTSAETKLGRNEILGHITRLLG